jgi:hypothetical protein
MTTPALAFQLPRIPGPELRRMAFQITAMPDSVMLTRVKSARTCGSRPSTRSAFKPRVLIKPFWGMRPKLKCEVRLRRKISSVAESRRRVVGTARPASGHLQYTREF